MPRQTFDLIMRFIVHEKLKCRHSKENRQVNTAESHLFKEPPHQLISTEKTQE